MGALLSYDLEVLRRTEHEAACLATHSPSHTASGFCGSGRGSTLRPVVGTLPSAPMSPQALVSAEGQGGVGLRPAVSIPSDSRQGRPTPQVTRSWSRPQGDGVRTTEPPAPGQPPGRSCGGQGTRDLSWHLRRTLFARPVSVCLKLENIDTMDSQSSEDEAAQAPGTGLAGAHRAGRRPPSGSGADARGAAQPVPCGDLPGGRPRLSGPDRGVCVSLENRTCIRVPRIFAHVRSPRGKRLVWPRCAFAALSWIPEPPGHTRVSV